MESARLQGWDYSSAGWYFVTVCTKLRQPYFGELAGAEVKLSPIGEQAQRCWEEIPQHFPPVGLDAFMVMPNHVHGIVALERAGDASLASVVGAYKAAVTRWCRANGDAEFGWQVRFYNHIIRDEAGLNRIREYIAYNPAKWPDDQSCRGRFGHNLLRDRAPLLLSH